MAQIGIVQPPMTFYHFQYPNATHMLLVADQAPNDSTDSFQVNPTSAYAYSERSWSLGCFAVLEMTATTSLMELRLLDF